MELQAKENELNRKEQVSLASMLPYSFHVNCIDQSSSCSCHHAGAEKKRRCNSQKLDNLPLILIKIFYCS